MNLVYTDFIMDVLDNNHVVYPLLLVLLTVVQNNLYVRRDLVIWREVSRDFYFLFLKV